MASQGTVWGDGVAPGTDTTVVQPQTEGSVFGAGEEQPQGQYNDPYGPLAMRPPTWGEFGRHWGGLGARAIIEANPADLPGNLYDLGANAVNRATGTDLPLVSTPGERFAAALNLPEPSNAGEAAFTGAIGLPAGMAMTGPLGLVSKIPGMRYADALYPPGWRQVPGYAAIGAGTSAVGQGLPPELQAMLGIGGMALGGQFIPGMRAAAPSSTLDLRDAALARKIDIPTSAVGPAGARGVVGITSIPGSGARGAADRSFTQWADSGARDIGAKAAEDGRFTQAVLDDAQTRTINPGYTYVRANAAPVSALNGSPLQADIMTLARDMARNAVTPQPRITNLTDDLLQAAQRNTRNPGHIPGSVAVQMLQGGSALDNMIRSPANNEELNYARQLKAALQKATEGAMAPDVLKRWKDTNRYYSNLKTYEDARTDTAGTVTPQSLDAAALRHSDYLGADGGDPGLNARIGTTFHLAPPSGGGLIKGALHGGGTAAAGMALSEGLDALRGMEWLDPATLAKGALFSYAPAVGLNRLARGLSGGPNPPSVGAYYGRALSTPGLYVGPGAEGQQVPITQPLLPWNAVPPAQGAQ